MTTADCRHARWVHRACRDPHLTVYVCHLCGLRFPLPVLWPKPRLYWCKHVLRLARASRLAGPRCYMELACRSVDVPYLHALLMQAGYQVQVPEFSSVLLVRGGGAH